MVTLSGERPGVTPTLRSPSPILVLRRSSSRTEPVSSPTPPLRSHDFLCWTCGVWCGMIVILRIRSQKFHFQTARQSEITLKTAKMNKKWPYFDILPFLRRFKTA